MDRCWSWCAQTPICTNMAIPHNLKYKTNAFVIDYNNMFINMQYKNKMSFGAPYFRTRQTRLRTKNNHL